MVQSFLHVWFQIEVKLDLNFLKVHILPQRTNLRVHINVLSL